MRRVTPTSHYQRPLALILIGLAVVVGLAVAGSVPARAGEEVTVDGVLHVRNTDQPSRGVRTVQLEELWQAGGEDDEEIFFGVINKVLVDDANDIYLLDQQLSEIMVFSADGELIKTLGREGEGPGEFRRPADMAFMPDGTIGVVQTFPGKVIKLGLDGTPAGTWQPTRDAAEGGFFAMVNLRPAGSNLVASGIDIAVDQAAGEVRRHSFLSSFDPAGKLLVEYVARDVTMSFQDIKFKEMELMDFIWRRMDVAPDGRVVVAIPRYGYQITVFAPDGTVERVIERAYESWDRDEEITELWTSILETTASTQAPPGTPVEIEDREPDVEFLRVTTDGAIWVLTSRAIYAHTDEGFTTYDVFDPNGHFVEQVRFLCEGDPRDDMLFFGSDDLVFLVEGFMSAALSGMGASSGDEDEEAEPMKIICYRMR
jgi:hypothetical protein